MASTVRLPALVAVAFALAVPMESDVASTCSSQSVAHLHTPGGAGPRNAPKRPSSATAPLIVFSFRG